MEIIGVGIAILVGLELGSFFFLWGERYEFILNCYLSLFSLFCVRIFNVIIDRILVCEV